MTLEGEEDEYYHEREQSLIKHIILRQYLERFAHIIGSRWPSITYIDGFSGPWKSNSPNLLDTSFGIAIRELRTARQHLVDNPNVNKPPLKIRCFFVEKDREAFQRLRTYVEQIDDVEIQIENARFGDAVPSVIQFIRESPDTFPFIFLDPTGWSGYEMSKIQTLLSMRPSEVLINFMTSFVSRFVQAREAKSFSSFADLYGSENFLEEIDELVPKMSREDAIVDVYAKTLASRCGFDYYSRAIVLNPRKDRSHFHLVYATRHVRGLQVFKEAEHSAVRKMLELRLAEDKDSQDPYLFDISEYEEPQKNHLDSLRSQSLCRLEQVIHEEFALIERISYFDLISKTYAIQLVWEEDLRRILNELISVGAIEIESTSKSAKPFNLSAGSIFRRRSETP